MIRGILSGTAFGLVTVAIALSVASLLGQQPAGNTPPLAPQVDAPSEAAGDNREGTAPELSSEGAEADPVAAETPLVTAPEDAPDAVLADTESAALPETGQPETELVMPDLSAADAPDLAAGTEAPVLPNPQSVAPQVPVPEDDLSLATDPAIPTPVEEAVPEEPAPAVEPAPLPEEEANVPDMAVEPPGEVVVALPDEPAEAVTADTALDTPTEAAVAEATPDSPAELPVETEAPPPSEMAVEAAEPELSPAGDADEPQAVEEEAVLAEPPPAAAAEEPPVVVAEQPETTAPETVGVEEAAAEAEVSEALTPQTAAPEAGVEEPVVSGTAVAEVVVEERVVPETVVTETEQPEAIIPEAAPELAEATPEPVPVEPESAEPEPAEPEPAEPALPAVNALENDAAAMPETNSAVRINRPGAEEEAVPDITLTEDPETAEPETNLIPEQQGPALERFAADFENPEGKPLMSVILIDDGSLAGASVAVGSLPFPVTVALDPGLEGAADRMATYRAAGIEVMAIARLPEGARPADVMVTFESVFTTLPETIGVLDAGEGGLQANSAVADQAMIRFATDGRGVVTLDEGLNMASRAAAAAGVPSGIIYRDLDGNGQDVQVIRRFLDQAAFRARQDSGVILLGHVRADTLSALILWGEQNRAGQVAMAPVSAVLLAQE